MRVPKGHLLVLLLAGLTALSCGGNSGGNLLGNAQCSDGLDNDGDGAVDFPEDLGCVGPTDDSEDSPTSAQCMDGRDNDGDGKIDYPDDPGCFVGPEDDETDDCPDGPNCPQCSNGKDDDQNGRTDYPDDSGCESAADDSEFLNNPVACGGGMTVKQLPANGEVHGTLGTMSTSTLVTPCGGGNGAPAWAYVFLVTEPKVIIASTDDANTTADTVLDIRSADCTAASSHLACSDDISTDNTNSKLTYSLMPGTYYLIVSGHDNSVSGDFVLRVQMFNGEGVACAGPEQCGPGLVCREFNGSAGTVCAKPMCSDGVDNDGDGKIDYPNDPGCVTADTNLEDDDCPTGENCDCSDGIDNDGDGKTDYPDDPSCKSAAGASEACRSDEGVSMLTGTVTDGDTTGASDDARASCSLSDSAAPDRHYRLDLPAVTSLTITTTTTGNFDAAVALFGAACGPAEIACSDPPEMNVGPLAAGTYHVLVDGWRTTDVGAFEIAIHGVIKDNASCEGPLATAGALVCGPNHACKGTAGNRRCKPSACSDGIDNNGDGKIDFPFDPGCTDANDDAEDNVCPGTTCPVCSNGMDDDADGQSDFPGDSGCFGAASTSEVFCSTEVDVGPTITNPMTTGTLAGKADNYDQTCQSNTGNDMAFALKLPVPVKTLRIDTVGSTVKDTVVSLQDASCGTVVGCNDDGGTAPNNLQSVLTLDNVMPGNYAIQVDAYGSTDNNGAFKLNVKGTVAPMTACSSPLFTSGVLVCPSGTTCSAGKCQ